MKNMQLLVLILVSLFCISGESFSKDVCLDSLQYLPKIGNYSIQVGDNPSNLVFYRKAIDSLITIKIDKFHVYGLPRGLMANDSVIKKLTEKIVFSDGVFQGLTEDKYFRLVLPACFRFDEYMDGKGAYYYQATKGECDCQAVVFLRFKTGCPEYYGITVMEESNTDNNSNK